jgi:hypothetical protein
MRHAPLAVLLGLSGLLVAADAKPEVKPDKPAETAPTTTPAATPAPVDRQPDPTAAIVAEGKYVYRQRDVDALMLIATRHAKARYGKAEQDRLREVLTTALMAREPLMDALAALPGGFSSAARDALVLDLLDYEAEAAKTPAAPAAPAAPAGDATQPPPTTAAPAGAAAPQPAAPAATAGGPLLIRLPPLNLVRTLPGIGKRHLTLTIALFFRDQAQATKLQDRAPLVQDAILSFVQALSPAQFVEPNQLTLKDGITAAIIAKVPDFPPDAVLIPEMDAGVPDGRESTPKATAP